MNKCILLNNVVLFITSIIHYSIYFLHVRCLSTIQAGYVKLRDETPVVLLYVFIVTVIYTHVLDNGDVDNKFKIV